MAHNDIFRNRDYLDRLRDTIAGQYGLAAAEITPARRGYYGETWKVRGEGQDYFLKIDWLPFHQQRLQNGLSVVEYLCANGIDFVGRIIRTRSGGLCAPFDSAVMGLFEWVDGENVETDGTKAAEYQMLCRIYPLTRPGLKIPKARFSTDAAAHFYQQWDALKGASSSGRNAGVLAVLDRFREEISHCAQRLSMFTQICQKDEKDFYLTHGDAGGNFFVGGGRNYIFDWDEAMVAPLERDAWVMGCHGWARQLFNDTLRENGIPYTLQMERLAYYCYHMYFFYLNDFLAVQPYSDQSQRIADYLEDGWIKDRTAFADTLG